MEYMAACIERLKIFFDTSCDKNESNVETLEYTDSGVVVGDEQERVQKLSLQYVAGLEFKCPKLFRLIIV